jgi:hypothetical protein
LLSKNIKIKIYRNIILPFVLYGCETCSLTPREARRARVLENRVLRGIFGPKRDEVTGELRKLHDEGLNYLYPLTNIIKVVKLRRIRRVGHVARTGERRGAYGIWWGNARERNHLEGSDIEGRIILRWIFRRWDEGHGLDRSGLG